MPERITKTQRWLDLIAYLVARHLPVSVEELMEKLPAYAREWSGGDRKARESVRRKFERDKDELRELGIPMETVTYRVGVLAEPAEGYRIRRRDFYLPYLRLLEEEDGERAGGVADPPGPAGFATPAGTPSPSGTIDVPRSEAARAVHGLRALADLPAFPLAGAARSALRKITFDLDSAGGGGGGASFDDARILFAEPPGAAEATEHTRLLSRALRKRKEVTFTYYGIHRDRTTERRVLPYGLLFQHSRWYLVGRDTNKEAERIFRVDRMEDVTVNGARPNTPDYEAPPADVLERYRGREAWELGEADETVTARARFRFPTSLWAERNGYGTLVEEDDEGGAVREFQVRQPHAFLRWILSLEGEAGIESPPELREGLRNMAREVAALYG